MAQIFPFFKELVTNTFNNVFSSFCLASFASAYRDSLRFLISTGNCSSTPYSVFCGPVIVHVLNFLMSQLLDLGMFDSICIDQVCEPYHIQEGFLYSFQI